MPQAKATERERSRRRRRDTTIAKLRGQLAELTATPNPPLAAGDWPDDPAGALAEWSAATLVIPPGHPSAGQPLVLPDYGVAFIRDALGSFESLLSIGRKNAKSAIIAVYLLGRLVGPLRTPGYRAGVCSVNREKAAELWRQAEAIAVASELDGVIFRRAPWRIIGPDGEVDILAAERTAGHSSGYDDAILDELGLLEERHRDLVNGLRSSVSARNGRFIALSILGAAPFTAELLARKDDPGVVVHHYGAPEGCALDSRDAWLAANPGLGTVKSWDYMQQASNRAIAVPADAAAFRAHELNQRGDPNLETICAGADYLRCVVSAMPPRVGDCWIGADVGGAVSFSAAAAFWPESGRIELYAGVGGIPDPLTRSRADGMGGMYPEMVKRGELWIYDGQRETPLVDFVGDLVRRLEGATVAGMVADEYRAPRLRDALVKAGYDDWAARLRVRPVRWLTGHADVIAFQGAIIGQRVAFPENVMMPAAIRDSKLVYDNNANCRLDRGRDNARIDLLMSAVLAVGAGERNRPEPGAGPDFHGSMAG